MAPLPGDLVVRSQRWNLVSNLLGIVIGEDDGSWLVLWTAEDERTEFRWHLADALLVVQPDGVTDIGKRRALQPLSRRSCRAIPCC